MGTNNDTKSKPSTDRRVPAGSTQNGERELRKRRAAQRSKTKYAKAIEAVLLPTDNAAEINAASVAA